MFLIFWLLMLEISLTTTFFIRSYFLPTSFLNKLTYVFEYVIEDEIKCLELCYWTTQNRRFYFYFYKYVHDHVRVGKVFPLMNWSSDK